MALGNASPKVLANKGVPVEVYTLKRDDHELVWPPRAALRADENKVTEERFVRLGNMEIAEIEERWDGLDPWQEALRRKPFSTIIETLMICWAEDEPFGGLPTGDPTKPDSNLRRRAIGTVLLDARMDDYATAIGGAFMLANGVEPDAVGKALRQGIAASRKTQEKLMSRLRLDQELTDVELEGAKDKDKDKTAALPDSTSPPPSEVGSSSTGPTPSSGN